MQRNYFSIKAELRTCYIGVTIYLAKIKIYLNEVFEKRENISYNYSIVTKFTTKKGTSITLFPFDKKVFYLITLQQQEFLQQPLEQLPVLQQQQELQLS